MPKTTYITHLGKVVWLCRAIQPERCEFHFSNKLNDQLTAYLGDPD
jgi:hypothetical protein